ncbi:D-alanyl-D-alanine carboxypeptidase family protein [Clostridium kluyveri]|uniref:D-alanyl-D-alanine carboxypeptidase family protein n=1 Tax=Clostridium kluyveri TaxID=1534 RepID=UPI00224546F5|nr:D-alanyl-D-alanine carboxypeptidase family protein [Clostridium kluyveri]UZQ51137.1 D-alanyl-D-alanine carboxypeptidase [Clostridium kluyveri]
MKRKNNIILFVLIFTLCLNLNVSAADESSNTLPEIYGTSAITVDMQTNEIIYEKNPDTKIYPASTTKLLTAILLEKNKKETDMLAYTAEAKAQPQSSLNSAAHPIEVGDTISAKNVMDALLMFSANDMACVIAENISKSIPEFANKMNEEVQSLNLKNTHFVTPNGLHSPEHYSTSYDMSIIAREAFKNSWIRDTIYKSTSTVTTSKGASFAIMNTNKLLGKDGCIGGKTGYTDPAGRCLVAIYERDNRKILGIVMNSIYDANDTYVFNDMEKIINWSYSKTPYILHKKDSVIDKKDVKFKFLPFTDFEKTIKVPIKTEDNVSYYDNDLNKKELQQKITITTVNMKSLKGEIPIGILTVKQRDFSKSYKIYSGLSKKSFLKHMFSIYSIILIPVFILILIFLFMKNKSRRYKKHKKYSYH